MTAAAPAVTRAHPIRQVRRTWAAGGPRPLPTGQQPASACPPGHKRARELHALA
jgi:hypothetical protein